MLNDKLPLYCYQQELFTNKNKRKVDDETKKNT